MESVSHGRTYGIKLIWPTHLFPVIPYFVRGLGDDLPALMNFKNDPNGRKLADGLPIGHRCLVYVTEVQLFIWVIEFTGTVTDGEVARKRHGIPPTRHQPFTVYRPIRFVAKVEPWDKGAPRASVCAKSGVDFSPTQGDSHVDLTEDQYNRMFNAIPWTLRGE